MMNTKKICADKKYLAVPVWIQNPINAKREDLQILEVWQKEKCLYEYFLPPVDTAKERPDYYAWLPISVGDDLEIRTELSKPFLDFIHTSKEMLLPQKEQDSLHYTSPYGFINDPNGLIYKDGIYHLFYQHNPMNNIWENMTWGHAISEDLLHFTFVGDALFPDERGVMYSGCAILNERGEFGLPKDALLFFYTSAGGVELRGRTHENVFTQRMAYSLDNGKTLIKYEDFEIPHIVGENRDPDVFWHEESQAYICVLYLDEKDFVILRSKNLKDWEESQRLSLPPMWECPDLICLTSEGGEEKWAFLSADGFYYIGSFDGYKFEIEGEMKSLYADKYPYAAQTYSNLPDERVIQIAWLRTEDEGKVYRGAMGVARELRLAKDAEGWYIHQSFVKEAVEKGYVKVVDGCQVIRDYDLTEKISKDGKTLFVEISTKE